MFHVGGGARIYRSDGCGAIVKLDDFGKVTLITGASEIGQGSETVLAMIVAETLGVPLERVDVVNSDTRVRPWDVGTHASRTTFVAGNAARLAAEKVRAQLLDMAAAQLDEPAAALAVKGGWVFARRDPQRRVQYEAVARAGHFRDGGRVLVAEAFYDPPTTMLDKDFQGNVSAAYTSAFQAAMVDVDPESGRIVVRKVVSAHDVGRALNPAAAEGQVHGGVHMGLGYALSRAARRRAGTGADPDVHGLRDLQGGRHAGDRRAADRVRRRRGTVRRQGPRRVRRHSRRGRGAQRDQGCDRRPVHRVTHHARARAGSAVGAAT